MPEPVFWAYAKMLPRLEAMEELRLVRASGAPWMENYDRRDYLRNLERTAHGKGRVAPATVGALEAMNIGVVEEDNPA